MSSPTTTHRGALVLIAATQLMIMLDMTITNVALPAIQSGLGFSVTALAWVIDAYILTFGGLLILGGRLGDLLGRRRLFIIGVSLFTTASLLGGLASSPSLLIAARALQGVGAALTAPSALAMIAIIFPEGRERHRAMSVYAAMTAAGGASGLISGGILVQYVSWPWVFFVNIPIGALIALSARVVLPHDAGHPRRIDIFGAIFISTAAASFVFGIISGPEHGWATTSVLVALVLSLASLIAFVITERTISYPLIPLRFLVHRNRIGSYVVMGLVGGAMVSLLFHLTQFMQAVLHYSPVRAGFSYLPIPIMVATNSIIGPKLIRRFGPRPLLVVGPILIFLGMSGLALITAHSSYLNIVLPLTLVGIGMGQTLMPVTLNAVAGVKPEMTGLASALLTTSNQMGASVVLAIVVSISTTWSQRHPLVVATSAQHVARAVSLYQSALWTGVVVVAIAVVSSIVLIRRVPTSAPAVVPVGD